MTHMRIKWEISKMESWNWALMLLTLDLIWKRHAEGFHVSRSYQISRRADYEVMWQRQRSFWSRWH